MILNFSKVTICNFGSYAKTELTLTDKGFCAVSGKNNYKKDNALSNGSGKSMLWSAICWALTGETISGLKSNLQNLNINSDECYVSLEFKADADSYTITRYFKPKSDLKIIKNDINESGKGIRESEQKLAELLPDLTKDLIASTIIIGQGMPNKFSSFSPSGRKELLEKLTKSDFMIEDIKERLSVRQNILQKQLNDLVLSINSNKIILDRDTQDLNKNKNNLEQLVKPDYDNLIKVSEAHLFEIGKDIAELTKNKTDLEKQIEILNETLIKISTDKTATYSKLNEDYSAATILLNQQKTELEMNVRNTAAEIDRLKAINDVCPTCGQKLVGVEKPDTTAKEAELVKLQNELQIKQKEVNEKKEKHDRYAAEIEVDYNNKSALARQQLNEAKANLDKVKNDLNNFTSQEMSEKEKLTKLKYDKDNFDNYVKSLQTAITILSSSVTQLQTTIDLAVSAKCEIEEHLEVIKKMETLTKRDFRGYLLTDIINYINQKAKDYCEVVFNTRELEIYLDGNALDITYCNKNIDALSGGERTRVDLITQLALRDLLQTYLGYSSNIIVLDEITDFLDKVSCKALFGLLSTILKDIESVFIISHHADELDLPIDSTIQIIKNENGISEIY